MDFGFEGLQDKLHEVRTAIMEWVDFDRERGSRHERILAGIHSGVYSSAEAEYDYLTLTKGFSGDAASTNFIITLSFPHCPQGVVWEVTHLAIDPLAGVETGLSQIASVNIGDAPLMAQVLLDNIVIGYIPISTNALIAAPYGPSFGSCVFEMRQPFIVTENRRISFKVSNNNGDIVNLQGIMQVRQITQRSKKLVRDLGSSEADFYSKHRTSKAEVNFGQGEVPDEQHTIVPATDSGREDLKRVGQDPRDE